jgi:hypothetical protein
VVSDPINLRQARKAKARVTREKIAAQNRVHFGQPKAVRRLSEAERAQAERQLDGLRLIKSDDV